MNGNLEYKKKLVKNIRKLQKSDYVYEKLLKDRNENMLKLIESQEQSLTEKSFAKNTGDKIKKKLSIKLKSINDDFDYVDEELDTIYYILKEMKDSNNMMET